MTADLMSNELFLIAIIAIVTALKECQEYKFLTSFF